jgi:hypothetical protein
MHLKILHFSSGLKMSGAVEKLLFNLFLKQTPLTDSWHQFDSNGRNFHPLMPWLTPFFTAGKISVVGNCHAAWRHQKTTVCTSIVYDITHPSPLLYQQINWFSHIMIHKTSLGIVKEVKELNFVKTVRSKYVRTPFLSIYFFPLFFVFLWTHARLEWCDAKVELGKASRRDLGQELIRIFSSPIF